MNERQIYLGDVSDGAARKVFSTEFGRGPTAQQVSEAVPQLETKTFDFFVAKYGVVADNLIVQFFLPPAAEKLSERPPREQQAWHTWWATTFPDVLSTVAQTHFRADYPRIMAKYTEEMVSWWFCARGFAHAFSPLIFLEEFLAKMNQALGARDSL